VCGLSRKNYNKVFAQQLRRLIESDLNASSFRKTLTALTGDASRWPSDDEFRRQWLDGSAYPGRLDAPKLRTIFHRLETEIRTEKTEEPIPLALDSLDIDHILPQSWYTYWPLADGSKISSDEAFAAAPLRYLTEGVDAKAKAILKREDAVSRIGNLTLVHYGVNRALQNHAFDAKRKALFDHSNLQLNRGLMQRSAWDEDTIADRGEALFEAAVRIWPGPG
jgi:hypothetical protein